MERAKFLKSNHPSGFSEIKTPIDLSDELARLGVPVGFGRIDWSECENKETYKFDHCVQAGDAVRNIININKLKGMAYVVWANALTVPIIATVNFISDYAEEICDEDWDCWIYSQDSGWIIEKYHEGEVTFLPLNGKAVPA